MGFVANAVKSVVGGVARVFGGGNDSSSTQTIVQQAAPAAQSAAPAASSAQQDTAENTSAEIAKRKRGKRSLMVDTGTGNASSTGLNI